jgi:hypothetical protein
VARDLAALAHGSVLLNFDEGADLRFIADFTSVQVNELGQLDVASKLDIRCDAHVRIHSDENPWNGFIAGSTG